MTTAHQAPGETRPGGRTARTRRAVLTAVFEELGDGGFAALTMERVAQRSGVHLATLYRRWRSVDKLVCELLTDMSSGVPLPDTGTLPGDLRALARGIGRFYAAARTRGLIEAVVAVAARDPQAATALRDFFDERLILAGAMVRRGIERGELPADTDPKAVMAALGAPFYYQILIARRPVEPSLAESAATAVWAAARAGAYATGDGRPDDGGKHDGAEHDGAEHDGGNRNGAEHNGAPGRGD
ncbi:TetR/AcrR family transcriptional regulator [Streptomyces sp. NPDC058000]|uniref:TetR/AcrR family transcriptional regulator n=1 Tax=Streptomyces sp. NPDC058000 TaxID=3346299 RepID=UPI0036EAA308